MSTNSVMTQATHVLIVDDDPDIRDALSDMLEHEGYRVHAVGTGVEAIRQARQTHYEAALLDMQLPDLHGHVVMKFLMDADPKLPIIAITAYAVEKNTIGSLTRGAFAYVTKPYNSTELKATLRKAIGVKALAVKAERVETALSESEERFRCLVESAPDAIIVGDQRGHIISWNQSAQRMFSYTDEEVLGKPLTLLMPARYREAHHKGLERLRSTGQATMIGRTMELHGLRKDGTEFPLELSLACWKTKEGTFYSGIIRDITERRRTEEHLAARSATTRVLAESATLREATPKLLQAISERLGWDLGALWNVDRPANVLRCVEIWHAPHAGFAEFIDSSRERTFAPGIGLPGRVWATGTPVWVPDVLQDHNFPREAVAAPAGLHGAVGFPILLNGEVLGVLEFFSREIRQPDDALLEMMASIGSQIGQFSERRRAEGALRESEERFRQMAENIREVFWMTDPEKNRIIYISPGYEQIWGRTCQSLYAEPRSWLAAIHPDDRDRVLEAALTKQVSGEYDEEYRIVRPDRSIRWIQDRAFPIRDESGKIYRVTGIAEDITDRKEAQAALRTAYDMMEEILASLPGAILIVNEDRQVAYANPLAEQHFGSPCARLVGSPVYDVLPLTESRWNLLMSEVKTVTAEADSGQPDGEFEVQKRVYQYRLFPVMIREREPQQTGIVIWDITEQKQLQDQLIQAEKLASLGTLVSGMAHEINNPVQGILGMAEIIAEEDDQAKIKEYATDIVGYAKHVAKVVGSFVSYARPASRDGEVEMDLSQRLLEAVKMVRLNPQFGDVEVVTQFESVPRLRGRQSEIDQVFVNLIYNAVQAMEGTGRLTLATRQVSGFVSIMISDTGCGIPKTLLNRIFDPFFTTKDPGKGTGLGLSIVYTIVSRYAGTIRVESEEGKGTTFTLQFPAGNH